MKPSHSLTFKFIPHELSTEPKFLPSPDMGIFWHYVYV